MILEPHGAKTLKRRICSEGWEENEKIRRGGGAGVPVPGRRTEGFPLTVCRHVGSTSHAPSW